MARYQRHLAIAARAGSGRLGDLGLLPGATGGDLPPAGQIARESELEALAALLAAQEEGAATVRIGDPGIGAVELIDGCGRQQAVDRLPLGADLNIVETLGLQRLGVEVEAAELIARLRQVGAGEAAIDR